MKDGHEYLTSSETDEFLSVGRNAGFRAIKNHQKRYKEATGNIILFYDISLRTYVRKEELEPFLEWYDKESGFFRTPASRSPQAPLRKEMLAAASQKMYDKMKKRGEEKGLPGLEEYAVCYLVPPPIGDGSNGRRRSS